MTQKLDYYVSLKDRLIDADAKRDKAFRAYQNIYHCKWQLPEGLEKLDWLRMEISTDPHDAISAGVRVMTSIPPKIKIVPLAPDKTNKKMANEKERVLSWALHCANRRRPVSVEADVMLSALLASAVSMNVVFLDWQIQLAREAEADTRRLEAARRYGQFVVNTYNPQDVHVLRSSYGPELVLLAQKRLASEVVYEWGGRAKKLKEAAENGDTVNYYSAMDYTDHCVWAEVEGSGQVEIIRQGHDLPFLNWVALMGGSTLEADEEYKYHPILFPIYYSGQWDTKNVIRSLNYSDVIARSGAPRYVVHANDVNNPPIVNAGDIARGIVVGPNEAVEALAPPQIDAAALQVEDRLEADISRSTVSQVLTGGEVAAGMSFAALNLQTLTATGALKPAKELAEKALAEMFKLMCLWSYHTGIPIEASGTTWTEKGLKFTGETLEMFDDSLPDLNITVELKPDLPTDQLQRINAASIGINNGIISKEQAMEDIGITDPEAMTRQIIKEQILQHKIEMKFAKDQMEMEQEAAAAQMDMQAQMQPPEQQQPLDAGVMPPEGEEDLAMMENMQGEGFNPGMGGLPPALMAPAMTREMQNGSDQVGNPLAGLGV